MSGIGTLRAGATTYLRNHAFSEALVSILPDYEKLSFQEFQESKTFIPQIYILLHQISGKALRGCYGAVNSFLRRKLSPAYQDGKDQVKECELIEI